MFKFALTMMFIAVIALASTARAQFTMSGVVDFGGVGENNVAVQMYAPDGSPIGPYVDTTDAVGFYSIPNVDAGAYDISFRPRTSSGFVPVYMAGIVINSNLTLNLTLESGFFYSGTVSDAQGNPIEAVDLNVYEQNTGIRLFTPGDNTDVDGFYEIVLPAGLFRVAYRYRGSDQNARYVPVEYENVSINSDTNLDVTMLEGFFITGTVLNPDNGPVMGADLDARDLATGSKIYTPNDNTDGNGDYNLIVPPGSYEINVAPLPSDHLLPGVVNNFVVNSDVALNFNLEWGLLVSGTVRDPNNNVVFNVNIDVQDVITEMDLYTPWDRTDSNGVYQVVVPAGTYNFEFKPAVVPPYLAGYRQSSFNVSGDTQLNVSVPFGVMVTGTVTNATGAPVGKVDLDAVIPSTDVSVPLEGDDTDSLGNYACVVEPGSYNLEFEPQWERHLTALKLTNQSIFFNSQFNVALDTGTVVSGTIIRQNGNPIPDVRFAAVESVSGQEVFIPADKSDSTGHYQALINPEVYDLTYSPDPLSGIPDTITYSNVNVAHDTVINVVYGLSPAANFSGSPQSGNAPLQVSFTDLSSNNPTSWSWDFGDGGTSDLPNPVYVYQTPGVYTISLTVSNSYGSDVEVKTNYVEVIAAAPVADFSGNPRFGLPPLEVHFTDLSQNGPTSWSWDFGDAGSDNVPDPTHVFNDLGSYTVTLTVTNAYGSDDEVKTNYIVVSESGGCGQYIVGDYNGNGVFNVADVVSAFSRLQTGSPESYLLCECPTGSGNIWAVAMDLNATCGFNIADIITGFSKLQTGSPEFVPCPQCPPGFPSPGYNGSVR